MNREGAPGWGDAGVIVPWLLHRIYGDRRILEEMWDSMAAWVAYAERSAAGGRRPERIASRPEPAPHEQYLIGPNHTADPLQFRTEIWWPIRAAVFDAVSSAPHIDHQETSPWP